MSSKALIWLWQPQAVLVVQEIPRGHLKSSLLAANSGRSRGEFESNLVASQGLFALVKWAFPLHLAFVFITSLTLKLKSFGPLSLKRDDSFWDPFPSIVIRGFAFWSCNMGLWFL
uniref:Uncharacterized protein n=1 Tax=Opuntia streptacantha TaxID=393608 RepID=A0A7C9B4D6_OPUST